MPTRIDLNRRYPTRRRLWLAISTSLFVAVWFLPVEVKSHVELVGNIWVIFFTGQWICSWSEMLAHLFGATITFAVAATVLGWIIHAIIVLFVPKGEP